MILEVPSNFMILWSQGRNALKKWIGKIMGTHFKLRLFYFFIFNCLLLKWSLYLFPHFCFLSHQSFLIHMNLWTLWIKNKNKNGLIYCMAHVVYSFMVSIIQDQCCIIWVEAIQTRRWLNFGIVLYMFPWHNISKMNVLKKRIGKKW